MWNFRAVDQDQSTYRYCIFSVVEVGDVRVQAVEDSAKVIAWLFVQTSTPFLPETGTFL